MSEFVYEYEEAQHGEYQQPCGKIEHCAYTSTAPAARRLAAAAASIASCSVGCGGVRVVAQRLRDDCGNVHKADFARQKAFYGSVVRAAEGGGPCAAAPRRIQRQVEAGVALALPRQECQRAGGHRVEAAYAAVADAAGMEERVLNGQAHIGRAYLRLDRTVNEFNHGVD